MSALSFEPNHFDRRYGDELNQVVESNRRKTNDNRDKSPGQCFKLVILAKRCLVSGILRFRVLHAVALIKAPTLLLLS